MKFLNTITCRVINFVEHLKAPRQAFRARATDAFLSESIESEVPQFKPTLVLTLTKGIKFGMHLVKQISISLRHRVGLHLICAHRQHLASVENDAAMPLGSVDADANLFRQLVHITRAFDEHQPFT